MYEEESDRFLDLKDLPAADQSRLTYRFNEEFERYVRGGEMLPRNNLQAPVSTGETRTGVRHS
jgi:hypothetical protein